MEINHILLTDAGISAKAKKICTVWASANNTFANNYEMKHALMRKVYKHYY